MGTRRLNRVAIGALLAAVSPLAAAGAVQYALIWRANGETTVEVRLACAYRLDGQLPADAGREFVARLVRVGTCSDRVDAHESVRPSGREMARLEEITWDVRGNDAAELQLRFVEPVQVEARPGTDPRVVKILVTPRPDASVPPLPRRPAAEGAAAAPALSAEQQARVDSRLRALDSPAAPVGATGGEFAIHLASFEGAPDLAGVPPGAQPYLLDAIVDGRTWHQLRIGFYPTEQAAETTLRGLTGRYPGAWVVRTGADERRRALAGDAAAPAPAGGALAARAAGTEAPTGEQRAALMAEARAAMLARDYPRAVDLYVRLLGATGSPEARDAREFLGLARERQGRSAEAIAEYQQYLADYPDGEGAVRVGQRLVALTTARDAPRDALRSSGRSADAGAWRATGSFAQYYRYDAGDYADYGMEDKVSLLQSDGDFTLRGRGDRFDFATRATIGYDLDLLDEEFGPGDRTRVYNLYADLQDRDRGLGARVGRQTERGAGVLGRFDGARVSWLWRPDVRFNVLGGYPVYLSYDGVESDRRFYAVSADISGVAEGLDTSFFFNTQEIDGIEDRQALGTEVRYSDEARTVVGLVDYDIGYGRVNTLNVTGNWAFGDGTTVSASADYRRHPLTLTEAALVGQSATSIEELLRTRTEDEIRQLAEDRSGEMLTYSVGVSRPLAERWQVNADFSVLQIAEGPTSGGVRALPDSGTEYYAFASLVGSSLFTEGDVSTVGVRYSDTDTTQVETLYLDSRYPLTTRLRINPRLAVSLRQLVSDDSSEVWLTPAVRLLYRFGGHYEIEFEGGGEFGSNDGDTAFADSTAYYLYLGYRADF